MNDSWLKRRNHHRLVMLPSQLQVSAQYFLAVPSRVQDFEVHNREEIPSQLVSSRLGLYTPHTTGSFGYIIGSDQPRVWNVPTIARRSELGPKSAVIL